MNKTPKISVIVPVYNVENYLCRCVDSIINQTFTDFEVLLIDDGSPDSSGEICDEYAKKDSRVRVFHKKNGGVSSARNLGILNAKGEWLCFIDSDDWIESDAMQLLLSACNNDSDIIQFGYKRVKLIDNISGSSLLPDTNMEYKVSEYCQLDYYHCGVWGYLIKSSLIQRNHILFPTNIKYGEDQAFILKCILSAKTIVVSSYHLYYYYDNPSSVMNASFTFLRSLDNLKVIEDVVSFAKGKKLTLYSLHIKLFHSYAKSYLWGSVKSANGISDLYNIKKAYSQFVNKFDGKHYHLKRYNNYTIIVLLYILKLAGFRK